MPTANSLPRLATLIGKTLALTLTAAVASVSFAYAASTNVAVAANFTEPAKAIAQLFESKTGHKAVLSSARRANSIHRLRRRHRSKYSWRRTTPRRRSWSLKSWLLATRCLHTLSARSCCSARMAIW